MIACNSSNANISIGGLPQISKHREQSKIRGEAEYFLTNFKVFKIVESPSYECLNVLLKRTTTSILRENQGESWPNLCNNCTDSFYLLHELLMLLRI